MSHSSEEEQTVEVATVRAHCRDSGHGVQRKDWTFDAPDIVVKSSLFIPAA